jgi:hypothetical protein
MFGREGVRPAKGAFCGGEITRSETSPFELQGLAGDSVIAERL